MPLMDNEVYITKNRCKQIGTPSGTIQVLRDDDMLSLRNFYVNFITFWSSQGILSNNKSKKTEDKRKEKIVARLV